MQPLPQWLVPLPDADAMRAVDRWAIEEMGVPGLELMERAGERAARELERLVPDGPVLVLCGGGNNGGDGLVIARLLRDGGRPVQVACTSPPGSFKGDALANLRRLPGPAPVDFAGADLGSPAVIVDALLGTGFAGEPRGAVALAIEAAGGAGVPVLAVDVPSGVDASTGQVRGAAVDAALTVTFHAAKPGLWIHPGKGRSGRVVVSDIGVPRGAPMTAAAGLIGRAVLDALPRRKANSTKFTSGHVVIAGGSRGLTGAPVLAARGSMRAGAGYVTACVPSGVQALVASIGPPELMCRGAGGRDGAFGPGSVEELLDACSRAGSLVLGPGLGRTDGAAGFARELASRAGLPLLLDADGLGAHAGRLEQLAARAAPTVLTPHAGELARLLGLDSAQIEQSRLEHAREAARRSAAVVVLKGDDTIVAEPSGLVAVSEGASPALATAGTGDVLGGVIGGLLAQGVEPFTAAAAGVYLHAAAGRLAATAVGAAEGVLAWDVAEQLPMARSAAGAG